MRLEEKRDALDGGGIGVGAAFGEALSDERLRVSEGGDAEAIGATAAEIAILEEAIGGLGEHAGESKFADALGTCKEESAGDTVELEHTAECRDGTLIAEEIRESHGCSPAESPQDSRFDSGQHVAVYHFLRTQGRGVRLPAFDSNPMGELSEIVVAAVSFGEMREAGFLEVAARARRIVSGAAAGELLGLCRREAKINDEILEGQAIDAIFEVAKPGEEAAALAMGDTSGLVGEIGGDVAVGEKDFAGGEGAFEQGFALEAVTGVEQGGEVGVNLVDLAEAAAEVIADEGTEEGIVAREADAKAGPALGGKGAKKEIHLGPFAGTIDAFECNQFSPMRHVLPESLTQWAWGAAERGKKRKGGEKSAW